MDQQRREIGDEALRTVAHYQAVLKLDLTAAEKADLIQYLKSL